MFCRVNIAGMIMDKKSNSTIILLKSIDDDKGILILIYVDDRVFEKFKQMNGDTKIFDTSEEGKKRAEYLSNLKPEDFGKYKV